MKNPKINLLAPVVTAVLLSGLVVEEFLRTNPASAEPYHARIAAAAAKLPYQIGDWVGMDQRVPDAATALLKPNVIISRCYRNLRTGHSATLLLVQCRDSRDMLGHYPPICYPGNGWTQSAATPREAVATDASYPAMQYDFNREQNGQLALTTVIDFMILPDGRVVRTMEELRYAARKNAARFYGAAQIQLIFDPDTPESERNQAIHAILDAAEPVIRDIKSGESS
ncbi:MAG: exosortase-associated EpsI family protein [Phycisphaerae bacterium]